MDISQHHEIDRLVSEPPTPRRRLMQRMLAVTAGGALASVEANAAGPHRTRIESPMHNAITSRLAKSCEQVGDRRECAAECRRCAKSCRTMT